MAKLIIKRQKSMVGMALAMKCYINDNYVCDVINGGEAECYIDNEIVNFRCGLPYNPMSDTVSIDARAVDEINIVVKQGGLKADVLLINLQPLEMRERQANTQGNVFWPNCVLCGKKMKFFNGKIMLKDGFVCNECWNTKGIKKRINKLTDSRNYSSRQIQEMVSIINNTPTDNSAFKTNTLISDLIQFDDDTQTVQIISKAGFKSAKEYIRYDQIVSFDLIEDGETITSGGLGGAVAGGVLLGMGGAIVGSVISSKKTKPVCKSLQIRISVKNYYTKVIFVTYIDTPTKSSSSKYKEMHDKARKAIAELQVAVSTANPTNTNDGKCEDFSIADEIEKLQSLYKKGIISEDEFTQAKKKVLEIS